MSAIMATARRGTRGVFGHLKWHSQYGGMAAEYKTNGPIARIFDFGMWCAGVQSKLKFKIQNAHTNERILNLRFDFHKVSNES